MWRNLGLLGPEDLQEWSRAPGVYRPGTCSCWMRPKLQVLWGLMLSPPHHHLSIGSCPCASKFALCKLEGNFLTAAARGHKADFSGETLKAKA